MGKRYTKEERQEALKLVEEIGAAAAARGPVPPGAPLIVAGPGDAQCPARYADRKTLLFRALETIPSFV